MAFVQEHFRLYNEVRLDPTNDVKVATAAATMTGGALARFQEIVADYRARGVREIPLVPLPANLSVDAESAAIAEPTSTVDACWLNSNVLVKPGGNPDGTDQTINDRVSANQHRYILERSTGAWRVQDIAILKVFAGAATCEAGPSPASLTVAPGTPEANVVAFMQEHFRLYNDARLDPTNDDKVVAAEATMSGVALARFQEIVNRYRAEGLREVTLGALPARIELFGEPVVVDVVAGVARVSVCRLGSNVLVVSGGSADGTDRPIDETINAYVERLDLVAVDGGWIVDGIFIVEKLDGSTTCG